MTFIQTTIDLWVSGGVMMIALAGICVLINLCALRLYRYISQLDGTLVTTSEYIDNDPDRRDEVYSVNKHILSTQFGFLNTLISSAPLVGLFGTVLGILKTFQSISSGGGKTIDYVADGISEALITTEVGLLIALVGMIYMYILKRYSDKYLRKVINL